MAATGMVKTMLKDHQSDSRLGGYLAHASDRAKPDGGRVVTKL